jgi:hypothetical protein
VTTPTLERRLRLLAQKWIAQARHPQRAKRPDERRLLEKCASELEAELHTARQSGRYDGS